MRKRSRYVSLDEEEHGSLTAGTTMRAVFPDEPRSGDDPGPIGPNIVGNGPEATEALFGTGQHHRYPAAPLNGSRLGAAKAAWPG